MTDNSSWVYQGRQQHGWFGTGTSPTGGAPPSAAAGWLPPLTLGERLKYVLGGVFARVPSRDRPRWSSVLASSASLERAVQAWSDASGLGRDAFRNSLLDHYANHETVDQLRRAASGIVKGETYDDLSTASDSLAEAAVSIGSDNWARFVASAGRRAPEGGFAGEGGPPGNFHILDPVYSHEPPPVRLVADATRPDIPEAAFALRIIVGSVIEAEQASPTIPPMVSPQTYGTMLHARLKQALIEANLPGLAAEASYKDGTAAEYGDPGSVRTDVVLRDVDSNVMAVWDYKTGLNTSMPNSRRIQIQNSVQTIYGQVPAFIIPIDIAYARR